VIPLSEAPIVRIPRLSEVSHDAASPGNASRSLTWAVFTLGAAKRTHISEDVEMTNGLIAGEGDAAEVLGVVAASSRAAVSTNLRKRR
jgi:hypothetical protein